jgi:hypothetical protein
MGLELSGEREFDFRALFNPDRQFNRGGIR